MKRIVIAALIVASLFIAPSAYAVEVDVIADRVNVFAENIVYNSYMKFFKAIEEEAEEIEEEYWEPVEYYSSYDYSDSDGEWRYTGFYPDENTGAFAYDENLEVFLGEDGIYRDSDGYVIVAANKGNLGAFDTVDTEYGMGKVYDTGCGYGIIDVYKERWVDEG